MIWDQVNKWISNDRNVITLYSQEPKPINVALAFDEGIAALNISVDKTIPIRSICALLLKLKCMTERDGSALNTMLKYFKLRNNGRKFCSFNNAFS